MVSAVDLRQNECRLAVQPTVGLQLRHGFAQTRLYILDAAVGIGELHTLHIVILRVFLRNIQQSVVHILMEEPVVARTVLGVVGREFQIEVERTLCTVVKVVESAVGWRHLDIVEYLLRLYVEVA